MKIIDGYRGESHITASMVMEQNIGLFGNDLQILDVGSKLAVEKISTNGIRVRDGAFVYQGIRGLIEAGTYEDITFDEGEVGKKRIDVLAIRYEKNADTNVESLTFVVKKGISVLTSGTPAEPEVVTGSIRDGASVSEVKLCSVSFNQTSMTLQAGTTSKIPSIFTLGKDNTKLLGFMDNLQIKTNGIYQIPGGLLIQWGRVTGISVPKTGQVQIAITYGKQFTVVPFVLCHELGNYNIKANAENSIFLRTFNMNVRSLDGIARTDRVVQWLAIGY